MLLEASIFHVVADQDIGVYALSQAQTTSDAF